jgi:uncharacterized protein (TIGR01777 family)
MALSGKIIVAGGSGLIGRDLVQALSVHGAEVVVLTRRPQRAAPAGGRSVGWDGRSVDPSWCRELADAAGVVNLAGTSIGGPRWTRRRKQTILSSRVDSTRALVDAIGQLKPSSRPPVLVNASGIDFAGDSRDASVTEEAVAGTSFLARVCAEWETAATRAAEHGTRVVCMRTSLVIARNAPALRLLALPFRLFVGGRLGDGSQWFPWLHIDDAVRLYRHALDDERLSGPLNAVAPDVRRQGEVAQELGQALGRPARIPTPAPLLRGVLGEQADLLLHGQKARSIKLGGFAFRYAELPAALTQALT